MTTPSIQYNTSMLLISRSYGIYVCVPYVRLINCRFHLFRSSAFFFSSQYLLLFLKSCRSCVLLIPTPFISVICPSIVSWRRQFLLKIWPIQLAFLRRILFRSVFFYPKRSRTCSLVTFSDHFIFFILLQHHISKLFKYFRSNFLSVQVSEP
jgi:hypothetical protein